MTGFTNLALMTNVIPSMIVDALVKITRYLVVNGLFAFHKTQNSTTVFDYS